MTNEIMDWLQEAKFYTKLKENVTTATEAELSEKLKLSSVCGEMKESVWEKRLKEMDKKSRELRVESDALILMRDMMRDILDRNTDKINVLSKEILEHMKEV